MVIMPNPIVKTIDGKAELLTWMVFIENPQKVKIWETQWVLL